MPNNNKKMSKKTQSADYEYLGQANPKYQNEFAAETGGVQPAGQGMKTKDKPKGHC